MTLRKSKIQRERELRRLCAEDVSRLQLALSRSSDHCTLLSTKVHNINREVQERREMMGSEEKERLGIVLKDPLTPLKNTEGREMCTVETC